MAEIKLRMQGFSDKKRIAKNEYKSICLGKSTFRGYHVDEVELSAVLESIDDINDLIIVLEYLKPSLKKNENEKNIKLCVPVGTKFICVGDSKYFIFQIVSVDENNKYVKVNTRNGYIKYRVEEVNELFNSGKWKCVY